MKNFILISPNYPENFYLFAKGLKKFGANVLCVVDTDYDSLNPELKEAMTECYRVNSFNNYDEVYKAVAYFASKYGKPEWIESNNEAWLTLDARLRDDFNVRTGFTFEQIDELQSKAAMKKYYEKAGINVAPYRLIHSLKDAIDFANEVGYSLVLKPDHGVGASNTWHIFNEDDLRKYYEESRELNTQMILEKYIDGEVMTLDGICDANGKIRFLGSMEYVNNCMDSVQNHDSIGSYYNKSVPEEQRELAQRVCDAFGLKNRFFHGEYFRLNSDMEGIGHKGELLGLEVNFRPPGGFCPDLLNWSYDVNIYEIWAEIMMTGDVDTKDHGEYSAGFAGRRFGNRYKYDIEALKNKYYGEIMSIQYLPEAFAHSMGDETLIARFKNPERQKEFYKDAFERTDV